MARRRRREEHENHERWLVSYADFITLLFAFFVVMYSISSVNEGKFKVVASSLVASFREPARSLEPIQVGELTRLPHRDPTDILPSAQKVAQNNSPVDLATVIAEIEHAMAPLIEQQLVELRRTEHGLEVEMRTSLLFASGSAQIESTARPVLGKLAAIVRRFPNAIEVEGFTDNVPISTVAYPSNWELSAARAASVVHLFVDNGVQPTRMVAIGYGEHHPIADNHTPEGRNRNRRVVITVLKEGKTRRASEMETTAQKNTVPVAEPALGAAVGEAPTVDPG